MKKVIIIFSLVFLAACDNTDDYAIPNPQLGQECTRNQEGKCLKNFGYHKCDKIGRAKFIIECAKAANPMSDEEGEDLVKECERTSFSLFCESV